MPDVAESTSAPDQGATQVTDNYVSQVLLNPDGPQSFTSEEQPQSTEIAEDTTPQLEVEAEQQEQAQPDANATVETLIQKFAKELGLNPSDPDQRKLLKQFADKEAFIQTLKKENATLRGSTKPDDLHLTAFERSLLANETPQQSPAQTASQPANGNDRQAMPQGHGDIGDKWKSAEDAYTDLVSAWSSNEGKGDIAKVRDIENAMFARRFDAQVKPQLQNWIAQEAQRLFDQRLGPLVGSMQPIVEQRAEFDSKEFALSELRKLPDFADVDKLLQADQEGTIQFDGGEFPNTPFNRIVVQNPWIMHIKRENKDPQTASRLTKMDQYRAVQGMFKQEQKNGLDPAKANELVQAGKQVAQRTAADRARHGANAGSGGSRGPQGDLSYAEQLAKGPPGSSLSFSSLFGK